MINEQVKLTQDIIDPNGGTLLVPKYTIGTVLEFDISDDGTDVDTPIPIEIIPNNRLARILTLSVDFNGYGVFEVPVTFVKFDKGRTGLLNTLINGDTITDVSLARNKFETNPEHPNVISFFFISGLSIEIRADRRTGQINFDLFSKKIN